MSLTAGSICSGAGGLDLAVEAVFGCRTVWQAEVDPNASQVLAARFAVPNLGDITAVDWSSVEPVDVLSGGTPCQDMSSAGRRAGMRPGTRSGLWSAMAEAIDIIRPQIVVWENVRGALSACAHSDLEPCPGCVGDGRHEPVLRAPGRVLGDLADLGYDAAWRVVAAADVGACHRRDRLFLVAVAADAGSARCIAWSAKDRVRPHRKGDLLADRQASGSWDSRGAGPGVPVATDAGSERFGQLAGGAPAEEAGPGGRGLAGDHLRARPVRDGREAPGLNLLPTVTTSDQNGAGAHGDGGADLRTAVQLLPTPRVAADRTSRSAMMRPDTMSSMSLGQAVEVAEGVLPREFTSWAEVPGGEPSARWGRYAAAIARHEAAFGRPAPAPIEASAKGNPVLSARFAEWMMGWPDGWVTDLLPRRPALRACGNGVVPAQAAAAIRSLLPALLEVVPS